MIPLPVNALRVLFQEIFQIPFGVPPSAVRFEVVLPGPPFHLAICTRHADEPFQRALGRGFAVSPRFVVAVPVVLRREPNVFRHTCGVTALERFGVLSLVLATECQHQDLATSKVQELTPDLSDSWANNRGRFDTRVAAGWTFCAVR